MKKTLAMVLCLLLCASALPPARAAQTRDLSAEAELAASLKELGLFLGVGEGEDGATDFALDRAPSRVEALTMLVRAMGRGSEDPPKSHPFTDVPQWADGTVTYAWEQGLVKGVSDTELGAQDPATAQTFLTFLLRAMGYTEGSDGEFLWSSPWAAAGWCGILPPGVDRHSFLRADVVNVLCAALFATPKGETAPLYERLVEEGAFSAQQFAAAFPRDPFARYRALDAKVTEAVAREAGLGELERPNVYGYECHVIDRVEERDGQTVVEALVCTADAELMEDNQLGNHGGGDQPRRITLDAETLEIQDVQTQTALLNAGVPLEETSSPGILADREELGRGMVWLCTVQALEQIRRGEIGYRPLTYEERLAQVTYAGSQDYELLSRLEAEPCTIVLGRLLGTPHGSPMSLVLIYKPGSAMGEGAVVDLPLPAEHNWSLTFSQPQTLELSQDGWTLRYTYHFDQRSVYQKGTPEEQVVHEAGTYQYTVELATGRTTLEIVPD